MSEVAATRENKMMIRRINKLALAGAIASLAVSAFAQDGRSSRGAPKPVTVPISIRLRGPAPVEMRFVDFLLREDGEMQREVSRRTPNDSPMTLAILFQDDLVSSVALETKGMANFIRSEPGGSRVMVAYNSASSSAFSRISSASRQRVRPRSCGRILRHGLPSSNAARAARTAGDDRHQRRHRRIAGS